MAATGRNLRVAALGVLREDLVADADRLDRPVAFEGPHGGAGPEAAMI